MEVKAIDIRHTVFDNETDAILYVVKDKEEPEDIFIFSLPVYTFSVAVKTVKELEDFWKGYNIFGDPVKREKLFNVMKQVIEEDL